MTRHYSDSTDFDDSLSQSPHSYADNSIKVDSNNVPISNR